MTAHALLAAPSPSALRQAWLETALVEVRHLFIAKGHEVPANVRVSIGWGHGRAEKILGQCWYAQASSDGHVEIFISPATKDGARIVDILVHECVHSVVGALAGHKGPFKRVALSVGLTGKMTATTAGPELAEWCAGFIAKHGEYPAGSLSKADSGRKKQTTRMVKCECAECGYVARTTRKWIDDMGAPYCAEPNHGRMRTAGDLDGEE
jgi:hypothetical protein